MLSSNGDSDVFFDSQDYLPEESVVAEQVESSKLKYEIWMKEPQSIEKRRERFLKQFGLVEFASSRTCSPDSEAESSSSPAMTGSERLTECSGAVSSSDYAGRQDLETSQCEEQDAESRNEAAELPYSAGNSMLQGETQIEGCQNIEMGRKRMKNWWRFFVKKRGRGTRPEFSEELESESNEEKFRSCRMKVYQNKKRCSELSAMYLRQNICAHKGLIWAMKFSPDGKYLASGGEDGVVRIWRVTSTNPSSDFITGNTGKSNFTGKRSKFATVVIPEKVFQIDESPVQELYGHSSDVLDLAWSNSNYLFSSSKDKTVRMWEMGSDECLNVFHHRNYVTCIQCNPMDENHIISGSIDGKIRIWGVSEKRVVDWADVRDVITAVSYRPDGKGFVVGSITGTCRFYESSGDYLHLEAEMNIKGRKKSSGKRITGIQFCPENNSRRLMVTSEDSKVRIIEGTDIVDKYKGLPKSGSQMSASFTQTGKHIVSIGEDSRVYMWNYDGRGGGVPSTKQTNSRLSCEHFFSDGVSVAIPWPSIVTEPNSCGDSCRNFSRRTRDSEERVSVGNWFSTDVLCRGSATWPEEKLPLWDLAVVEDEHDGNLQHQSAGHSRHVSPAPETWGLVIVAGGLDGTIKTFHNYGLPIRL